MSSRYVLTHCSFIIFQNDGVDFFRLNMLRKKVLGVGTYSATLLVEDADKHNQLRVLRRINVSGWSDHDIAQTVGVYNAVHKTGPTQFRVAVDSVLLQNSFLNVLCDYCADGSLADYVERLKQPIPDVQVVSWMMVIVSAVMEVQAHGFPHCGISARNIFLVRSKNSQDSNPPASVVVALPLPLCCYLQRKRELASLENSSLACPPEVQQSDAYDLYKTDVWHVGFVAKELISAGESAANGERRAASLLALIEEMLDPNPATRLSIGDVIISLKTIQGEVNSSSSPTSLSTPGVEKLQQSTTPPRKVKPVSSVRPVLDSSSAHVQPAEAQWQKRAQAQFAELQSLQQRSAKGTSAGTDSAYFPAANTQGRKRSPSPQVPTSLHSPRSGSGPHLPPPPPLAEPLSPRQMRSGSKPRSRLNSTGLSSANHNTYEDPAALRRREIIEKEAAMKRAKHQEETKAAILAQKLHQEKMRALKNQRGKVGGGSQSVMSSEIRKSIRSWQQATSALEADQTVVISSQGGVSIYAKNRSGVGGGGDASSPMAAASHPGIHPPIGGDDDFDDMACGVVGGDDSPKSLVSGRPHEDYEHDDDDVVIRDVAFSNPPAPAPRPEQLGIEPLASTATSADKAPPVHSSIAQHQKPQAHQVVVAKVDHRHSAAISQQQSTAASRQHLEQQSHSNQRTREAIGVVATLEWSIDTLSLSLRQLMDPPVFEEVQAVVRDFSSKPASERFSCQTNADLLSALTNLLGDDEALASAVPLCCQLVALESVWRLSDDLLKLRSSSHAS